MPAPITDRELLDRLKDFAIKHNRVPHYSECNNKNGLGSLSMYSRRFGSLARAIQIADLPHLIEKQVNK